MTPSRHNPDRVSLSEINCFQECEEKWYWQYMLRLSLPQTSRPLRLGSALHTFLAIHHYGGPNGIASATNRLGEDWESYVNFQDKMGREVSDKDRHLHEEDIRQVEKIGLAYAGRWGEIDSDIKVEAVEKRFEDSFVRIVDLITLDGEDRWVWEHKTTSRKMDEYLNTLYTPSLEAPLTCLPVDNCVGIVYNIISMYSSRPEFHRECIPISQQRIEMAKEVAMNVWFRIEDANNYPSFKHLILPSYAWHCSRCEYERLCTVKLDGTDVKDVIDQNYIQGK